MKEYVVLELENGSKCVVVDMLEYLNKKYFLVTQLSQDEKEIDDEFKLCIYNEERNYFEKINNEQEHDYIMSIFDERLEKQKEVDEIFNGVDTQNMIKLRVVNINGYDYTLESPTGERVVKNIEFYVENKPKINNYIYISKKVVEEPIMLQYGLVNDVNHINTNEIIKLIDDGKEYFYQRYYG